MLRSPPVLPLWPTLLGVNFWLIALLVPLLLARATASSLVWMAAPLAPLTLVFCLGLRRHPLAQLILVIGVPLAVLLPTAEGALASARLHPPLAVAVQLAVLVGYLAAVCAELARGPRAATPPPPAESPSATLDPTASEPPVAAPTGWELMTRVPTVISSRLRRRIGVYRLLLGMCVVVPLLFLYAINWYPDNVRAFRAALGSEARATAMQAALTAGVTMLWSVLFHFCFMVPMDAHLDHDRALRTRLATLREVSRRGRPRVNLYAAIAVALLSMGLLIWWSL